MTPPGARTKTIVFSRRQLISAQAVLVDKGGKFVEFDTTRFDPVGRGKAAKKKKGSYKGPDENGNYRSYALKIKKSTAGLDTENEAGAEDEVPDGDFSPIANYIEEIEEEDGTHYMLYMRKFGLAQSRTRVRSNVNKVESYVRKRRQKLIIKENASLPWQGILCLVFGLMGILLTMLVGQFWEPEPRRHGGPGARRQQTTRRVGKDSKFYIDTGRPSKYPKGYSRGMKPKQ
eukprot:CAMPEP_0198119632 /NCGR_PEP_ID=MMETSP1442-20131203/26408_1 /TAXON_ID= /ORGANISM="Craspedostauros australis, Strain CCMP3328" /LENGTH=230 /DNA_ID=CAMNT_0043778143 /DNA_START=134 /DNA_END=826 /DNA_ORIENTATION=+